MLRSRYGCYRLLRLSTECCVILSLLMILTVYILISKKQILISEHSLLYHSHKNIPALTLGTATSNSTPRVTEINYGDVTDTFNSSTLYRCDNLRSEPACKPYTPCVYKEEVDFRVIVLTYNR